MIHPKAKRPQLNISRLAHEAEGGALGALAGMAIGSIAGPPGMVAGAIFGALAGGVAGAVIDGDARREAVHSRELDGP